MIKKLTIIATLFLSLNCAATESTSTLTDKCTLYLSHHTKIQNILTSTIPNYTEKKVSLDTAILELRQLENTNDYNYCYENDPALQQATKKTIEMILQKNKQP